MVDEIDIILHYKLGGKLLGKHFFNQKKRYVVDLWAIYDSDKRITYMLIGFSNVAHDARVWDHTNIYCNSTVYLSLSQYIWGDAAYIPRKYIVLLYKVPEADHWGNHVFNKQLSHIQIDIKYTFRMWKRRRKSLTGIPLIITDNKKCEFGCIWIAVCRVLHNILIDLNDNWSKKEGQWTENEKKDHDNELLDLEQQN